MRVPRWANSSWSTTSRLLSSRDSRFLPLHRLILILTNSSKRSDLNFEKEVLEDSLVSDESSRLQMTITPVLYPSPSFSRSSTTTASRFPTTSFESFSLLSIPTETQISISMSSSDTLLAKWMTLEDHLFSRLLTSLTLTRTQRWTRMRLPRSTPPSFILTCRLARRQRKMF